MVDSIKITLLEALPTKIRHHFFGKSRIFCQCKHWRGWHVVNWEEGMYRIVLGQCTSCDCKVFVQEIDVIYV